MVGTQPAWGELCGPDPKCAQRLSASLWSARRCRRSPVNGWQRSCSTPFGITVVGTRVHRRTLRPSRSAQRLSASLWSAQWPSRRRPRCRSDSAQRLSASLWSAPHPSQNVPRKDLLSPPFMDRFKSDESAIKQSTWSARSGYPRLEIQTVLLRQASSRIVKDHQPIAGRQVGLDYALRDSRRRRVLDSSELDDHVPRRLARPIWRSGGRVQTRYS